MLCPPVIRFTVAVMEIFFQSVMLYWKPIVTFVANLTSQSQDPKHLLKSHLSLQ